jgi:hypothetical protein
MMRRMLVLACLVAGGTTANAAGFSIAIPAGWKDTTYASPDVDGVKARLENGGKNTAEVQHHTAPDGTTVLVTFVESYPDASSREELDALERSARDTTGKEVSYRATDEAAVRTTVQVSERDGTQVYTRRQVGFLGGRLRAAGAVCSGAAATCGPVIASLALDTTDFIKLAELRATTPPRPPPSSDKLSPFELGMRIGFIVGIPTALFLVFRRRRKNRL